jgi:prophage DNA circulation protein
MTDTWSQKLQVARFAGMAIDIVSITDQGGLRIAEQVEHGKDGARLEKGGAKPRRSQASIIFYDRPATSRELVLEDHLTRLQRFMRLAAAGAAEFVHPIDGPYQAVIEDIRRSASADQRNQVTLDCAIWEDTDDGQDLPGQSTSVSFLPAASTPAYAARADALIDTLQADDAALVSDGLADILEDLKASEVTTRVTDTVAGWQADPDITSTQIASDADALSAELAAYNDAIEASDDMAGLDVVVELNLLQDSMRAAVDELLARRPATVTEVLPVTQPLFAALFVAYGSHERVLALFEEVFGANFLYDPLLLEAGTTISRPSANPRARVATVTR